jgi:two-component system, response regulator FlrC
VRELENAMHRAVLMADDDRIGAETIVLAGRRLAAEGNRGQAEAVGAADGGAMVGRTVAEVERRLIIDTLQHCLGNRTHAANILGISIRTMRNKLRQYSDEGFSVPMPGEGERTLA